MWPLRKPQSPAPVPQQPKPQTIMLYSTDDLLVRAEKIVWLMGYRGATGDIVLHLHRILKKYAELDGKEPGYSGGSKKKLDLVSDDGA